MNSLISLLFQFDLLLLLLQASATSPFKVPTLSPFLKEALMFRKVGDRVSSSLANWKDFKAYFYTQTLDHYSYTPQSYATFRQRYVVDSKYWGGPHSNSPIFAYLGAEEPIDDDLAFIGFLTDVAPHFKSLSVYIEVNFLFSMIF